MSLLFIGVPAVLVTSLIEWAVEILKKPKYHRPGMIQWFRAKEV